VPLRVFGKLVRDEGAEAPFRVRDLQGVRRPEDRAAEAMPALLGVVYRTNSHPESAFSEREWDSEQKRRHLERFSSMLE
jgi:hypothetical protein